MDSVEKITGNIRKDRTTYERMLDTAFDELVELDMSLNSVRSIYHVEGKYYVPILQGGMTSQKQFALGHMVHPEDRPVIESLFDFETLEERMKEAPTPGILIQDLRQRLVNGTYWWVRYILLRGEEHGLEKGKLVFFVYDIQNLKDRESGSKKSEFSGNDINALTGVKIGTAFLKAAENMVNQKAVSRNSGKWCMIALDVEHFKIFNEWYGKEKGDYLLARIGDSLQKAEVNRNAVCGYFGMDDFCICMPYNPVEVKNLYLSIRNIIVSSTNTAGFSAYMGISVFASGTEVSLRLYDQALSALSRAKQSHNKFIEYYDPTLGRREEEEYRILTDFQMALSRNEINFYLQPICRVSTGRIVSCEALARWRKSDGSIVSPSSFVPILEKTGFITDLDKQLWEKVCRWLRMLLDRGIEPVPVSLNVSRRDIFAMDVSSYLYALAMRYNIPTNLIKVEITESTYAEESEAVSALVDELKKKGFPVLMDDFGSGYSSLNMLSGLSVDIIKLDMRFIQFEEMNEKKGISIIESIVHMSKSMGMPIVAEGVETKEQVQFLRNLGCRYIQGFFFYRPMDPAVMEDYLIDPYKIDHKDIRVKRNEQFRVREFMDENMFTDSMLNNIIGPVAFYQQKGTRLDILRFNEQFYQTIGDANMETRQVGIENYVVQEDRVELFRMLEEAYNDRINGGSGTVRFYKSDGSVFWFYIHMYFLTEEEQGRTFYGQIQDMTESMRQSIRLYDLIKEQSDFCYRVNMTRGTIQKVRKNESFGNMEVPTVNLEAFIHRLILPTIPKEEDKKAFVRFFEQSRITESKLRGDFEETLTVEFLMKGGGVRPTRLTTFVAQTLPGQDVYISAFGKIL